MLNLNEFAIQLQKNSYAGFENVSTVLKLALLIEEPDGGECVAVGRHGTTRKPHVTQAHIAPATL